MSSYAPKVYVDGPTGKTPITAAKLNSTEQGIAAVAGLADVAAAAFRPNLAYAAGQPVVNPNGELVTALLAFTAGPAFVPANWSTPASATYAPFRKVFSDDFSRYADGPLAGKVPLIGPAWQTTGSEATSVVAGRAGSVGTGYAWANIPLTGAGRLILCETIYATSTTGSNTLATSIDSPLSLANLVHAQTGPTATNLTLRANAGLFESFKTGAWRRPFKPGVRRTVGLLVIGDTVTVFGPNGESFTSTDAAVGALHGGTFFIEPNGTGTVRDAEVTKVDVYDLTGSEAFAYLQGLTTTEDDTVWQTKVGRDPGTNTASIRFGPDVIRARLNVAVAIGATSIVTHTPLLVGVATTIDTGAAREAVTVTATSGMVEPYTATVTALTKAHAAGTAVTVPTVPASQRSTMTWNPAAGIPLNITGASGLDTHAAIYRDAVLLIAGRNVGWTEPTGADFKGPYDAATVTLPQLAQFVRSIYRALALQNGLLGP